MMRTLALIGPVAAHPLVFPLLQHAEEFDLDGGREVADFVEEKRSAFGLLDAAHAAEKGPREGPLFVAEEFALQKAFAERRHN